MSFHQFLSQGEYKLPEGCQAVCHEDLGDLCLASGDFSEVDFSGIIISGDITGCKFEKAYLMGARFKAIFQNEKLEERDAVDFSCAILAFGYLHGAKLRAAKLDQADLSFSLIWKKPI